MIYRSLITILLLTSASSFAEDNKFYPKTALGLSVFKEHKMNMSLKIFDGESKHRPARAVNFEFAGGYYINDTFRTDLGISIYKVDELESKFKFKNPIIIGGYKVKKTPRIMSTMVGVYANLFNWKDTKFFIGGKIGFAQIKEKIKISTDYTVLGLSSVSQINTIKNKKSNNLAYGISFGSSTHISESVIFDTSIGYSDFGKSKSMIFYPIEGSTIDLQFGKTRYRNVKLELGLRFNI